MFIIKLYKSNVNHRLFVNTYLRYIGSMRLPKTRVSEKYSGFNAAIEQETKSV